MLKRYSAQPEPAAASGGDGSSAVAMNAGGTHVSAAARRAVFATAIEQVSEAPAQVVSGRLPSWLRGSLLLNGCGDFRGMQHLFDGYACLSRVRLDGQANSAWASQRFLDTDAYRSFRATGRLKYREFGTPAGTPAAAQPKSSLPLLPLLRSAYNTTCGVVATLTGRQGFSDNASVTLTALPSGQLLALSEPAAATYLVDPHTLAATHHVVYGSTKQGSRASGSSNSSSSGQQAGAAAAAGAGVVAASSGGRPEVRRVVDDMPHSDIQTAHVKHTPDGGLVNFSRSLPFGGYHVYVQDPVSLKRKQIAFIRDRDPFAPCWVHDMAVTRSHLVVVESPLHMNLTALMTGGSRPYVFMDWRPEAGTRVHVIALDGSGVVTHTAPALFTFHFSNAFEQPSASAPGASEICVDFSVYDDPTVLNDLSLKQMMAMPGQDISPSRLRRLTIPLRDAGGKPVGPSRLAAPAPLLRDESAYGNFVEFPAFNPKFTGLPYRYCYSTAAVRPTNMGNALAVHDLQEGVSRLWHSPGGMPAEPCFVPRPGSSDEADGVVLAAVVGADGGSSVVVLEGGSLRELARVQLPVTVPYRFHGTFVQQQQ
ncbi:hypothetical protein HYH02_011984 [Chlamydomonas schloesseri]|uniref:Uncharacterized protein n=1 Tax=Chlamydomonas schloesseri TaxID=2026947 RepID=A0A835T9S8_9CHLO|nr:hypothetical protein HYH02_011984 [Chlamydomonas schloesseri]|eukprot:KAG2434985.1 hypothetical protein HYH02_011984 [Chlamydomonas schloesseri]